MPKTITDGFLADLEARYGRWMSYPQAATETGSSVRTLKRETEHGGLPCYRIGRARVLRLKTADVAALVERVA